MIKIKINNNKIKKNLKIFFKKLNFIPNKNKNLKKNLILEFLKNK